MTVLATEVDVRVLSEDEMAAMYGTADDGTRDAILAEMARRDRAERDRQRRGAERAAGGWGGEGPGGPGPSATGGGGMPSGPSGSRARTRSTWPLSRSAAATLSAAGAWPRASPTPGSSGQDRSPRRWPTRPRNCATTGSRTPGSP